MLVGLALMYAGNLQVYRGNEVGDPQKGFVFFLNGIIVFSISVSGVKLRSNDETQVSTEVSHLSIRWGWLAFSVGVACWITDLTVHGQDISLGQYILLWLLSMATFVIAVSPAKREITDSTPLRKWEYVLLLVLFLGAFAIRGINIDREPHLLDGDEALFAVEGAHYTAVNFKFSPFQPGIHSHPRLYTAMIGVTIKLFGINLLGARLPSVLMGALLIPAVYLLGRELRDWQAGLIAALFLMGWSFHIQFSRLAMNQPGDPLFVTLSFYFLLRRLRTGAASNFALSGIMLGVAQMFYMAGRLAPLIMIAYLVYIWLREREVIKRRWRLLLLVPAAAFLVTLPQNYYLLYNGLPISTRLDHSDLFNGGLQNAIANGQLGDYLGRQVPSTFLALLSVTDFSAWYGRSSSIMGIVGGPLLVIGTLVTLWIMLRKPEWALPLGWTFTVIVAGSTLAYSPSTPPPQYERYAPIAPALALLVEAGITLIAAALATALRRPKFSRSIALGIGVLTLVANLVFYVGVYIPEGKYLNLPTNQWSNWLGHRMVEEYNAQRQVVLLASFNSAVEDSQPVQFFMWGKPYVTGEDALPKLLTKVDLRRPVSFFVPLERHTDLDQLTQMFPSGRVYEEHIDDHDEIVFYLFRIDHV